MPRDGLLRELAQLVRYAEPDGNNIASFVAEHAEELAQLLHSDPDELRSVANESDGVVLDRLRSRMELAFEAQRQSRCEHDIERAQRAARAVSRTARWFELGVMLDVDLVLGDLLAMPKCRYVGFRMEETTVVIPTERLRRARMLRIQLDLGCFVDADGVHVRWKNDRGRLNLKGRDGVSEYEVLFVDLPARQPRRPKLIADVLAEIGYGL